MKELFIKFRCVLNNPSHNVEDGWYRTKSIIAFGPATSEYIQIGAASFVDCFPGGRLYVVESVDEIQNAIATLEKES